MYESKWQIGILFLGIYNVTYGVNRHLISLNPYRKLRASRVCISKALGNFGREVGLPVR